MPDAEDKKRPAFQFYPGDWRKDVPLRSCSVAARGLWIDLMCLMHECEPYGHLALNGRPMTAENIAGQIGVPAAAIKKLMAELLQNGVARQREDGMVYSKRMVNDERVRNARAEGGKAGSEHGIKGAAHGIKGGRPANGRGVSEPPLQPPLEPPPSSSSSSSSSEEPPTPLQGDEPRPPIPCPYAEIVHAYHEALPTLPRAKLMPTARQRAMRKLWGWVLSSTKADGTKRASNASEALEWFRAYFARAAENDFLMGRTPRSAEHAGWQCDLDFLLTDRGLKQVIERTRDAA